MKKKTTVLVLGAQGMLGRVVYAYLKKYPNINSFGTSRKKAKGVLQFNANNIPKDWNKLLKKTSKNDYVVNCIATLMSYPNRKPKASEFKNINTKFPKFSEKRALTNNFRFIHISTDGVFNDLQGMCKETTKPQPLDTYGKSKLAGEVTNKNSLTVRTSIIGYDPRGKKGLFEWVKNSKREIGGYTNHKWSGATVLQVTELIEWLTIKKGFDKVKKHTSILHYAPLGPTNKYNLAKKIAKYLNKKLIVKKSQSESEIRRYLKSRYNHILPKYLLNNSIEHSFKNLRKFEDTLD